MGKVRIKRINCNNCKRVVPVNTQARVDCISCPGCLARITVNPELMHPAMQAT